VRRDPMAMLPFCGYNAGNYLKHWIQMGRKFSSVPKLFNVNWFRKNSEGKFIWPGYGENMRVLEWVFARLELANGAVDASVESSSLGIHPKFSSLNLSGLNHFNKPEFDDAMKLNAAEWKTEISSQRQFLEKIGSTLPPELMQEFENLKKLGSV
jgi:phosphoenolpyruvate carboxykinase (GTP)